MLTRIHLTIGSLAVVALVSSLALFDSVGDLGLTKNIASVLGVSSLAPISNDADEDGLSNTEESYWQTDFRNPDTDGDGFLDGEETTSGHDPLIPGPNDLLLAQDNLTAQFSDLTLAGLYEGSLSSTNPNQMSSLDGLASVIAQDGVENIYNAHEPKTFSVIGNSIAEQESYIRALGTANRPFLTAYQDELMAIEGLLVKMESRGLDDAEVTSYFAQRSAAMDAAFESILAISVPSNWSTEHSQLLSILSRIAVANRYLAEKRGDPIQSTIAISALLEHAQTLGNIADTYDLKIRERGLNLK